MRGCPLSPPPSPGERAALSPRVLESVWAGVEGSEEMEGAKWGGGEGKNADKVWEPET